MAAEHPYVEEFAKRLGGKKAEEMLDFAKRMSNRSAIERTAVGTDKQGMDTGFFAINPVTGEKVPIWIADYILTDYGTGAIMGVPAHDQRDFDFARKYNIPVITVVRPADGEAPDGATMPAAVAADGVACNSGFLDGLPTPEPSRRPPTGSRSTERASARCSSACATGSFRASVTGARRYRWSTATTAA